VTSGYTIDYLRPATGETLVARASAVSVSRRRAVCRCSVHAVTGGERVLVAVAQGTIAAVSATPAE
jgi:acyl-coenzyme A thioesterase PaaI-like protein